MATAWTRRRHRRRANTTAEQVAIDAAIAAGRVTLCPAGIAHGLTYLERAGFMTFATEDQLAKLGEMAQARPSVHRALIAWTMWARKELAGTRQRAAVRR